MTKQAVLGVAVFVVLVGIIVALLVTMQASAPTTERVIQPAAAPVTQDTKSDVSSEIDFTAEVNAIEIDDGSDAFEDIDSDINQL